MREGLAGFVAVSDGAIAEAIRVLLRTTHNLAEGAGAAGLAGLFALREQLAGKTVAVISRARTSTQIRCGASSIESSDGSRALAHSAERTRC